MSAKVALISLFVTSISSLYIAITNAECVSKSPSVTDSWCQPAGQGDIMCETYPDYCELTDETDYGSGSGDDDDDDTDDTPITKAPTSTPISSDDDENDNESDSSEGEDYNSCVCVAIDERVTNEWCSQGINCQMCTDYPTFCSSSGGESGGGSGNDNPTPTLDDDNDDSENNSNDDSASDITTASPTPQPIVSPSGSDKDISDIITREQFNAIFPEISNPSCKGSDIFTYDNFLIAARLYPNFGNVGSIQTRSREIAAFLAQTSQETSGWWAGQPYKWGYCFPEEVGCESGCSQYCSQGNTEYPCKPGQSYHGRGPMQLSWNYNYGQVSEALYGDKNILLNNPDLVISDGITAYQTAFWFWMTAQSPKPSCHDVMVGNWEPSDSDSGKGREPGFGMTTNIINGGLECNKPTPQKVENRVNYYLTYIEELQTTAGNALYCNDMQNY